MVGHDRMTRYMLHIMTETAKTLHKQIPLTRENLRSGVIRDWIKEQDPTFVPMAEDEVIASRHALFGGKAPTEDVWLFGYGSLIWNPTIEFDEKRCGTVFGVHRRFCLETHLGRGTPDCPVWRREMISNAYRPAWLKVRTAEGPVKAVGFVINRNHQRYCGDRCDDEIANTIAKAHGFLGPCCEYLFNTVEHLAELKIPDAGLTRLAAKVARVQAATRV